MAMCCKCGHDLVTRNNKRTKLAKIFCTNDKCRFHARAHPALHFPNKGPA